ncbi:hypothetical protein [Candidatus Frankia alpina]|uniref:hypothetical protein n=1 Tax=Candidatus Frankia alpina TaxID=2699483 RepID=UPI0013870F1A|nr:hypothetical protein [Candidatus Frankia alpina]
MNFKHAGHLALVDLGEPHSGSQRRSRSRPRPRRTLDAVIAADADLGAELQATITTGLTCRYIPAATDPRHWTVRR